MSRTHDGPWTQFHDMHSGGRQKLDWGHIWIQAGEDEARRVFYAKFGRNPENVTCDCCGEDYSVAEYPDLRQATAFERGLRSLDGEYDKAKKKWVYADDGRESGYLEPDEAIPAGGKLSGWTRYEKGNGYTLDAFLSDDVKSGVFGAPKKFVWREEITAAERGSKKGPRQVKVWQEVDE